MKIISIANSTGGSGKSTTALAIAVAAAEYGRNVLLIDLDERANLTFHLAIENPRFTMLEIATGSASTEVAIIRTNERIDFLPAAPRITAMDTRENSIVNLKEKFANYDLVVIDTSSALNQRLALAGELSDAVLYVCTESLAAIRGVLLASDFFKKAKSMGVLPIMGTGEGSAISALSGDFKILDPAIPVDKDVLIAQIENKSVLNYAKSALASDSYRDITYFLLEDLFGSKADATL